MYRVSKVLNNNGVIAIHMEECVEYVLLGKGIGFGKKVSQRFEAPKDCTRYSLKEDTERGSSKELAKSISPEYLEIADEILQKAHKEFGTIDRRILFPLADHISFAAERMLHGEQISNPMTEDIRALFYREYKVASQLENILKKRLGIEIDEHEIGYVALHIHSAIEEETVSSAMQMAGAIRECVQALEQATGQIEIDEHEIGYVALHIHSAIEEETVSSAMQMAGAIRECVQALEQATGQRIDVMSLAYNRLMNHVKYMVMRAVRGESIQLDMNDYMEEKHPKAFALAAFALAASVCEKMEQGCNIRLEKMEVGYLAMHIERVYADTMKKIK